MKAIRNTLFSLTLLASISVLYCSNPDDGQQDKGQSDGYVKPKEENDPVLAKNNDPVSEKNGDEDDKISGDDKGDKKGDSKDGNKKADKVLDKPKGFISVVVGCALLPLNAVDWTADKAFITSVFEGVGGWGLWKERWIGKKLQNYRIGLGRVVVISAIGLVGYYAWNKYQERKKQNEEDEKFDFRAFFDENEEDADVTFPTNAQ